MSHFARTFLKGDVPMSVIPAWLLWIQWQGMSVDFLWAPQAHAGHFASFGKAVRRVDELDYFAVGLSVCSGCFTFCEGIEIKRINEC